MTIIQSLSVIFLIIGLGIACVRKKLIHQVHIEGFEIFLLKIALPSYLFVSILHHDLPTLMNTKYIAGYLLTFLIIAGLVSLLFYRVSTWSALCLKILASGYVNTAIYTLPIITFLLKDPTAGILGNLLQIIVIQSIFVIILNCIHHKEKSVFKKLLNIISTPFIVMPMLGLLCNYLQINLHPTATETAKNLGSGASSIALFTFGLTLGSIKIRKENINRELILMILIKNIFHPMVAFFIGTYLLHLDTYWLYSLLISSSAPTAFIIYLIAKQFSTEQDLVKKVVTISSIISLFSLFIITFILG